jgi:hypothetical protein
MRYVILILCVLALGSCQWLRDLAANASTPEGQEALGGVVNSLLRSDYFGAVMSLVEYMTLGTGTYVAVNVRRDRRRKARNEPTSVAEANAMDFPRGEKEPV